MTHGCQSNNWLILYAMPVWPCHVRIKDFPSPAFPFHCTLAPIFQRPSGITHPVLLQADIVLPDDSFNPRALVEAVQAL